MVELQNLDIFSAISNSTRLAILLNLKEGSLKLGQIAQKMNMSIQAIQKHIDKLVVPGLIEKNIDGVFSVTPIGKITLEQIPAFQFLSKNRKYFDKHTFEGIPQKLSLRIGDLYNSEYLGDQMKAWQHNRDLCLNNREFLDSVTITTPNEFLDIVEENLKHGVKYRMVFGKNSYVPKGFYEYPAKKAWDEGIKNGHVQEKYVEYMPVTLVNTEDESIIVFSNKHLGEPDTIGEFSSKDPIFKQWCRDLFDYYWNDVPSVKPFKLKER